MAAWGAVAGVLLIVIAARLVVLYEPNTFLAADSNYYAETAISLITDHDLDLRNQLQGGLARHDGEVALGARGEWYPKHPILMPILTLPLLPLFGMKAFLVFNLIVLVGLGLTLYELAALAARPASAVGGTLATILGSFLILYDYNYSSNLFACLLLCLSVLFVSGGRPVLSGLLGGLSGLASMPQLVVLPFLMLHAGWRNGTRAALRFLAGAAVPLALLGALNFHMFGSPLVSPYMRALTLADGGTVLHSNTDDFNNPLWEGVRGQLLDPRRGLVRTAPLLLLALPGYLIWLRARRDEAALCLTVSLVLFLVFSRYRLWPTSQVGNRFLMPLVALSAPALACALQWTYDRARRWSAES